ncbi:MAG: hypothetical protein E7410_00280 [Ruminococcaceae bacterium]|nr:hypothetical protein [Oscillospiraceae bacterium]
MYTPIKISERITNLKKIYTTLTVPGAVDSYNHERYKKFNTGDRWFTLGFLRGWKENENADTTLIRSALAEAEEIKQSEPAIYDDELLLGHVYLPVYSDDEQKEYDALWESFKMSSRTTLFRSPRNTHIALDFEKLLKLGLNGIKSQIKEKMDSLNLADNNDAPDFSELKKYEFYQCLLIELDAVSEHAQRYAQKALEEANTANKARKEELLRLADILKKVPDAPAESFYEAIQSVHFFLSAVMGLYPLGRPDRYLYEYYKKDVEDGVLTQEFAQDLIDNFCLGVSDRVFSRSACGFMVGGLDKDGNCVENELTYMFLTALEHLKLPDPNGALCVNENTSDELLLYASEILSKGVTHPAFYNDRTITDSLVKNYGCSFEDAVNYIHTTCAEISIIGKSKAHSTAICCDLPKALLDAVKAKSFDSLEEIIYAFFDVLRGRITKSLEKYMLRIVEAGRIGYDPMRINALIEGCIESGKSIYEGGAKYTFIQPNFLGLATVVDSLYAIDTLVFKEKKLTFEEFCKIVENNYEGNEPLRQYIINKIAHYGNENVEIDALAKKIAHGCIDLLKEDTMPAKKLLMPGTFSYVTHASLGRQCGATFDARLANTSYSDGCSPVQGRDTNGPTAMIRSLTSWPQQELLGGMVVNIKFGSENLKGEKAKNFVALLRHFIERSGLEMQVNCVSRKTLEDAKINPEAHRDLIVRIGGYSDYFTRLFPELQQEIIDRTEY